MNIRAMEKKCLLFLIIVTLSLFLIACEALSATDYLAKHRDYLNRSLGQHEVTERRRMVYADESFYRVSISYARQNGDYRSITFSGAGNNGDADLARVILAEARRDSSFDLVESIASNYFPEEKISLPGSTNTIFDSRIRIHMSSEWRGRVNPYTSPSAVLDPYNGLFLYDMSPQVLTEKWGFIAWVSFSSADRDSYTQDVDSVKEMTRTLATYLNQDVVPIQFGFNKYYLEEDDLEIASSLGFYGYYDRPTDSFTLGYGIEQWPDDWFDAGTGRFTPLHI